MPFLPISSPADQFDVYWHSNLPNNDVRNIGHNGRPTVIILVPAHLSVDLLDKQFEDPVFAPYNLIAFDYPGYGQTKTPRFKDQVLEMDDWVHAAMVGNFCLSLDIPQVHVISIMAWAQHVSTRLAILFPTMVRSITCITVTVDPFDNEMYREGMDEIMQAWFAAADQEEVIEVLESEFYLYFGETHAQYHPEEHARFKRHWIRAWRGKNMLNNLLIAPLAIARDNLTEEQADLVQVPLLIMQGDTNELIPPSMAYTFANEFPSVPGGAQVHIVRRGHKAMAVMEESAAEVNHLIVSHIETAGFVDAPDSPRTPLAPRSRSGTVTLADVRPTPSPTTSTTGSTSSSSTKESSEKEKEKGSKSVMGGLVKGLGKMGLKSKASSAKLSSKMSEEDRVRYERVSRGMGEAMDILMTVVESSVRAKLVKRDPNSVMSFSLRRPEVIEELRQKYYIPWSNLDNHFAGIIEEDDD